jgi:hypothetical protein
MRSRVRDCLINRYPPSPVLTRVKNYFRRTQLIKPQFLPTPSLRYGVGLLTVRVDNGTLLG